MLGVTYPYLPGTVPVLDPKAPGQSAARFLDEVRARYGGRPRAPYAETWGQNHSGQLGNGSSSITESSTPVTLNKLSSVVTAVACGGTHCLAVRNGAVYAWGGGKRRRPVSVLGLLKDVSEVAASGTHSLAIQNGGVYQWSPKDLATVPIAGLGDSVTGIAAGEYFCLAIRKGAVWGWGSNSFGCLGVVALETSVTPVAAIGLTEGVTAIAAGDSHCLAIRYGALYSWGGNAHGELGNGGKVMSVMPARVPGFGEGVTAIAAGSRHSLAVCRGVVYASGRDGFVPVAGMTDIVAVAAGNDCSLALARDGSVWVWGSNVFGALGIGGGTYFDKPQRRLAPAGYRYLAVACRGNHGMGILGAV